MIHHQFSNNPDNNNGQYAVQARLHQSGAALLLLPVSCARTPLFLEKKGECDLLFSALDRGSCRRPTPEMEGADAFLP